MTLNKAILQEQTGNPFDLRDATAYAAWRERKLAAYPRSAEDLLVEIDNPHALTAAEQDAIGERCARANMAIYSITGNSRDDKSVVRDLGAQCGLHRLDTNLYADDDGISALQVSAERRQHEYIPYSNKAISWHTDGYYNTPEHRIRAMVLHCVQPAAQGGENLLMDHEMLYLLIRDENPQYIEALMQPTVMTIPANIENGEEIRPEQSGPVFSVDPESGHLHMRYTARTRSIAWLQDEITQKAVRFLEKVLSAESPYIFRYRLEAGQGVVCNNVLHTRSGFENDASHQRLVYRARYYDRIQFT